MTKRMLVDAAYPEETRVVVADNETLLDFDFEAANRRQLKGNIYLAKVIRVEPSLQAAFVDYGGNRHGFLAFSEIHPDYYQIPQADRDRLSELESQLAKARVDDDDEGEPEETDPDAPPAADTVTADGDAEQAELAGQLRRERARLLRSYKIQEVVRRRQIMLVQVVKEERGTKGAALTTYLSLAGRYCVLMPNTAKGGGISRKISTAADRTRLKKIAQDLDVPEGMGLIVRTAGQERTKAEIRRDYEYLLRLWSDIRDRTLHSIAPCSIHEEADLIRRAMRDLYANDIEEILVEGEAGYRTAKAFMTMLTPSRARRVKQYKADTPLFFAYKVEDQLDKMHNATVHLRSGGSIVIHTTEALTAIDVNSGRSTRERHIDETAVKTNLEAADEIARQMRLRDIAGLVVIDFIDMAEHRHQRSVEKRLRDALKIDRARLQVGRISAFGLLELSRQRLRPSFLELSTQPCSVCHGTGFIRSTESASLQALRRVEAIGVEGKASRVAVTLPVDIALYLLNQKRHDVQRIEERYDLEVLVKVDDQLVASEFRVEVLEAERQPPAEAPAEEAGPEAVVAEPAAANDREAAAAEANGNGEESGKRKRRRRRRPKRRSEDETLEAAAEPSEPTPSGATLDEAVGEDVRAASAEAVPEPAADTAEAAPTAAPTAGDAAAQVSEAKPKRRRRRKKPASGEDESEPTVADVAEPAVAETSAASAPPGEPPAEPAPPVAEESHLVLPPMPDAAPAAEAAVATPEASAPEPSVPEAAEPAPSAAATGGNGEVVRDATEPAAAAAAEAEPATGAAASEANGHGETEAPSSSSPSPARTPIEERPDVIVDDAAVTSQPRRQGWWSRWTRSEESQG